MLVYALFVIVFNPNKFFHATLLLSFLHWHVVVAHITIKTLILIYKAKNRPSPSYLKSLLTLDITLCSLNYHC